MRIVSLLPGATETLCALGLREHLVGVSHSCDYPVDVAQLPRVTSTSVPHDAGASGEIDRFVTESISDAVPLYHIDWSELAALAPDVIVSQALCDVCAVSGAEIEARLGEIQSRPTLVNMEPVSLSDILTCIGDVAEACEASRAGTRLLDNMTQRIQFVQEQAAALPRSPRVMLVEWFDPPFVSGHWNPELVRLAGGVEPFANESRPAYATDWKTVAESRPEALAVACCGFDIARTRADMAQRAGSSDYERVVEMVDHRVRVFDGDAYFNRPGPRIVDSLEQLHDFVAEISVLPSLCE